MLSLRVSRPGFLFSWLFVLLCRTASAQEEAKNIVISDAAEDIRFERSKDEQPVAVKQSSRTQYSCENYRTTLPVAELYNDEELIDDVDIRMNDKRQRGIIPKNDYYSVDDIFYSDARICYFTLPFAQKGDVGEVTFNKTILDPRYFNDVYFTDAHFIQHKNHHHFSFRNGSM